MANKNVKPRFKKGGWEAREAGRKSKRKPLDVKLAEMAEKIKVSNGKDKITADEAINRVIIQKSIKGDLGFVKEYNDRRFGKAKQNITMNTNIMSEDITLETIDSIDSQLEEINKKLNAKK